MCKTTVFCDAKMQAEEIVYQFKSILREQQEVSNKHFEDSLKELVSVIIAAFKPADNVSKDNLNNDLHDKITSVATKQLEILSVIEELKQRVDDNDRSTKRLKRLEDIVDKAIVELENGKQRSIVVDFLQQNTKKRRYS